MFKLYKKRNEVVDKKGQLKRYTNFYLKHENGNMIQIKPSFTTDFKALLFLAEDLTENSK